MKSRPKKPASSASRARQQAQSAAIRPSGQQQQAAGGEGRQYGEGNYAATREYNKGVKRHLESSDVEGEARDAAPRTAAEEKEMVDAERIGRSKARGEGVESPGSDAQDLQK